jgi:hypothetical protein
MWFGNYIPRGWLKLYVYIITIMISYIIINIKYNSYA